MRRRDPATGRFVAGEPPLPGLTREKVHEIAVGALRGEIFVAWTEDQLRDAFMILIGLMRPEQVPANAHTMYGPMTERVHGRAINGLPMMLTGGWLMLEDTRAVLDEYHRLKDLLETG